jgi:hypothetical protein
VTVAEFAVSYSQSGPLGGAFAGDGRQGSMKPIVAGLRCNMPRCLPDGDDRV